MPLNEVVDDIVHDRHIALVLLVVDHLHRQVQAHLVLDIVDEVEVPVTPWHPL